MIVKLGVLGDVEMFYSPYYWEKFDVFITHQGFTVGGVRVYLIAHPVNKYHNYCLLDDDAIVIPYSHTEER